MARTRRRVNRSCFVPVRDHIGAVMTSDRVLRITNRARESTKRRRRHRVMLRRRGAAIRSIFVRVQTIKYSAVTWQSRTAKRQSRKLRRLRLQEELQCVYNEM